MRARLADYQEQYGDLYNLEATPAESTTYRFAKHDKEQFPDIITANEQGKPYYTNSSHLPVGFTDDIFSALDVQDELQTLYTSGTVFHAFLGEKLPDWKAAATLVRKIAENYKLPYYTMSPTYSVCKNHGYLTGEQYTCPICGEKTEVYSRITGYYRPVQNWNDGKTQEFKDRKVYDLTRSHLRRAGIAGSQVTVEGCRVQVTYRTLFPAMERNAANHSAYLRAAEAAELLGWEPGGDRGPRRHRRGLSSPTYGVPTVDALSAIAEQIHTTEERVRIPSIRDRTALCAAMLGLLG